MKPWMTFALATAIGLLPVFVCEAQDKPAAATPEPAPVPAANPLKTKDELQSAYQKEYAFLEAQVRDLQSRLAAFDEESKRDEVNKEGAIDKVEGEYIDLQTQAERYNDTLADAEKQITAVEDARSTLEATFMQAGSTLESFDIPEVRSEEFFASSDSERIETLFRNTLDLLGSLGKVRQLSGRFFLDDGTEVEGTLIHIGNVATYGISDGRGGALAPAGDDRFKVWSASTPADAEALLAGRAPEILDIFLYESSQKAIEERAGKTFLSIVSSGGSIAWIIVALGALAAMLVVFRTFFLRSASASTGKVAKEVGPLVKAGKRKAALEACKRLKGSTARVVASAVRNIEKDRAHIEDIVSEQILHESTHLNRFGAMIMVIAAVAPLLGLLGTVTGMITTFDIITEFGTGDPKLLSSGISIALVTTEVGLAVAIPALIFGNLLSGWADSIKDEMEKAALHVMNQYKDKTAEIGSGD